MSSNQQNKPAPAVTDAVSASIVGAGGSGEYAMFVASTLSANGAFLRGDVFLEVEEEFTVELARGEASVRVRARVESLERGDAPGMTVTFVGVSSDARNTITNDLAAKA